MHTRIFVCRLAAFMMLALIGHAEGGRVTVSSMFTISMSRGRRHAHRYPRGRIGARRHRQSW